MVNDFEISNSASSARSIGCTTTTSSISKIDDNFILPRLLLPVSVLGSLNSVHRALIKVFESILYKTVNVTYKHFVL
jgi:hypothetical protein